MFRVRPSDCNTDIVDVYLQQSDEEVEIVVADQEGNENVLGWISKDGVLVLAVGVDGKLFGLKTDADGYVIVEKE